MSEPFLRPEFEIDWDNVLPQHWFMRLKKAKEMILNARHELETFDTFTESIYYDLCKAEEKIDKLLDQGVEAYQARWVANDVG